MAEKIKRVKASQIPDATNIEGFKAFGIKLNTDGTVDNVKVPMDLLKGNVGDKGDKGDKGDTGEKGDPNSLAIGTVQKGEMAGASITGTAPSQTLNLVLPKGDKGDKGDTGEKGDPNSLAIGTVQKGEMAGASITGTAPSQTLNLVLPKGDKGDKGDTGEKGDDGYTPVKGVDYFDGIDGEQGEKGDTGIGVPVGGTTGQQLMKKSNADYDFEWQTPEGAGDMLKSEYDKNGNGIVDNAEKVGGFTVGTNVPENAKFTDTIYSEITEAEINTGTASTLRTITARRVTFILSKVQTLISNAVSALTKASVGLGNVDNIQQATKAEFNTHNADGTRHITAGERTAWGAKWDYNESTIKAVKVNNATNADTVNGKTVAVNVPSGAKFTDTVYSHPTSDGNLHVPATGTTNNGKVLKAGATAGSLVWGTDNDTKTTINGKTGAITKADIVALGIPAQDTVYTHPTGTNPHGTTKADVGLGNVNNTSDANKPISTATQTALNAKIDTSKFQVVAELPASPATGVFYFVKE